MTEAASTTTSGLQTPIAVLKEAITIEEYTSKFTALRRVGRTLRGRCPIHGGDNAYSFAIDPERQRFKCFSCGESGDLIDVCEAVEKHADTWTACVSLAQQYGVEWLTKSKRWCEWQDTKGRRREMLLEALTRAYQRRYFRWYGDYLQGIEDEAERREEAERFYEDLHPLAYLSALGRLGL